MSQVIPNSIEFDDEILFINISTYETHSGPMAVSLVDKYGSPYATLSTNLGSPSRNLPPNQFWAKTWSENWKISQECAKSKYFNDLGQTHPTGYCLASLMQYYPNGDAKEKSMDATVTEATLGPDEIKLSLTYNQWDYIYSYSDCEELDNKISELQEDLTDGGRTYELSLTQYEYDEIVLLNINNDLYIDLEAAKVQE